MKRPTPTERREHAASVEACATLRSAWARAAWAVLAVALITACSPPAASAWTPEPARYGEGVTRDVKITMRDGTQLAADVHYPTNPDGSAATGPFPTLVAETPYGKELTGQDIVNTFSGYRPYLVKRGYIEASVDVRGSGGSQGNLTLFGADEAADSKQVIEWASKLPHSTGVVGLTGESYLGIDQLFAAAAVGKHSPLKAIFPMIASNDPYKDLFVSGGLMNIESDPPLLGVYTALPLVNPLLQTALDPQTLSTYPSLMAQRLQGLRNGFAIPALADVLVGGDRAYEDSYWQDPHRRPAAILKRIVDNGIPAYLVGGLYDVFQRGEPLNYAGLQNAWAGRPTGAPMSRTQKVTSRYQLLMKPTYHGTTDNGPPDLNVLQLAWFDHWLKGEDTGIERTSTPLHIVQANGKRLEAKRFPLDQAATRKLYLGKGGTLSATKPDADGADNARVHRGVAAMRSLDRAVGARRIRTWTGTARPRRPVRRTGHRARVGRTGTAAVHQCSVLSRHGAGGPSGGNDLRHCQHEGHGVGRKGIGRCAERDEHRPDPRSARGIASRIGRIEDLARRRGRRDPPLPP